MVLFIGDKEMMYKVNFCLCIVICILKLIKYFIVKDVDVVYE